MYKLIIMTEAGLSAHLILISVTFMTLILYIALPLP